MALANRLIPCGLTVLQQCMNRSPQHPNHIKNVFSPKLKRKYRHACNTTKHNYINPHLPRLWRYTPARARKKCWPTIPHRPIPSTLYMMTETHARPSGQNNTQGFALHHFHIFICSVTPFQRPLSQRQSQRSGVIADCGICGDTPIIR